MPAPDLPDGTCWGVDLVGCDLAACDPAGAGGAGVAEVLDQAVATGARTVRLSVEWGRCQPAEDTEDDDALARYACLLEASTARCLEPVVCLYHRAHPAWLGPGSWLRPDAPERFAAWADHVVARLGGGVDRWVTVSALNDQAWGRYLWGTRAPGRRLDLASAICALDNLLAAHVLAHGAIRRRQPGAVVALGVAPRRAHELDGLVVDALVGRSAGVARAELHDWLVERRAAWAGPPPPAGRLAGARRRLWASAIPLEQALPRALTAVYASRAERSFEALAVEWDARAGAGYWERMAAAAAGSGAAGEAGVEAWVANGLPRQAGVGTEGGRALHDAVGAAKRAGVPVTRAWRPLATCGPAAAPSWPRTRRWR